MLVTNSNNYVEGKRKRSLSRFFTLGPMSSKIIGIVLLALLGLFYLAQSTQSATRNYTIQNLEDKKKELETAKDEMTIEAMRLKSLNSIQDKAKELNLEPE